MDTFLVFALLGAATGSLYALSALGIVVISRGSGVLNLATGAITGGKVTGGARAFKGATGTLTATPVSSTKTAVKLTYKT